MHILVCDDDAVFAAQMDEYISEWFRAREIQVQSTVCTSGEQLLATPELERYQLAFLDVDLKTTDGIALGRRLRQVPRISCWCTSRRIWNLPRRATRSMPIAICSSGILPLSCPAVWRISLPA